MSSLLCGNREIGFFHDGNLQHKVTSGVTSSPGVHGPQQPIGQYGGPSVSAISDMLVDYVHVYQNSSGAVAITPQAGYGGPGDTRFRDAAAPTAAGRILLRCPWCYRGPQACAPGASYSKYRWNQGRRRVGHRDRRQDVQFPGSAYLRPAATCWMSLTSRAVPIPVR